MGMTTRRSKFSIGIKEEMMRLNKYKADLQSATGPELPTDQNDEDGARTLLTLGQGLADLHPVTG
jgi:hypothetical protein